MLCRNLLIICMAVFILWFQLATTSSPFPRRPLVYGGSNQRSLILPFPFVSRPLCRPAALCSGSSSTPTYCDWIKGPQDCLFESYIPLCGSDGVTYTNGCSLCVHRLKTSVDITVVHEGECQPGDTSS